MTFDHYVRAGLSAKNTVAILFFNHTFGIDRLERTRDFLSRARLGCCLAGSIVTPNNRKIPPTKKATSRTQRAE